jgi:hypothetical protein
MTLGMLDVLGGLNPQFMTVIQPQSIISMIIILVYAWFNFNKWTDESAMAQRTNPPRHFTTFWSFIGYASIYTILSEAVYIAFLIVPGLFDVLCKAFNIPIDVDTTSDVFQNNYPLWLLVLLVSIVPNTPGIRKLEQNIRRRLHKMAFIPAEAESLVHQFMQHPARFVPNADTAQDILETIGRDLPDTVDIMRPDKRLEHQWFKLSYLLQKIKDWKENREAIQYYAMCGPILKNCETAYRNLQLDIRSFFLSKGQPDVQNDPETRAFLEARQADLENKLKQQLEKVFTVICCGVLATQKTKQGRLGAFQYFDLQPDFTECPRIYLDIILACIFLTTIATFVTTYLFSLPASSMIRGMDTTVSWTMVMLFLQGASILSAVWVYRELAKRKTAKGAPVSGTVVLGPRTDITIGALTGYLAGGLIIFIYTQLFITHSGDVELAKLWPWPMIPAGTAGFVVYYLISLDVARKRLAEGLIQGITMAVVGALAYIIFAGLKEIEINPLFLAYCAVVCGTVSFAIGWTFPEEYRRRRKGDMRMRERRRYPRICVSSPVNVIAGDQAYAGHTLNLSLTGAKLPTVIPQEVGSEVQLELHGIGQVQGVINRKDESGTTMELSPEGEIRQRLSAFLELDSLSPAYG